MIVLLFGQYMFVINILAIGEEKPLQQVLKYPVSEIWV
jgi:hypothetical protein